MNGDTVFPPVGSLYFILVSTHLTLGKIHV